MAGEIPTRFDPAAVEARVYSYWEEGNFFDSDPDPAKQPYTIMIPPPNVTAALHMGHAFDNACQDVFIRYHRARGRETLWMPGTDHAGIATQNVVERQLREEGLTRHDLGREAFVDRVWAWREHYGDRILQQLRRLGASCDWRRTAFTMDDPRSRAVTEAFVRLFEKGLIYRGKYIVNWCPRCQTALSNEEAVPHDTAGHLWHVRYPIAGTADFVVVATTRPETMLGDTGVAIHPKDDRYRDLVGKTVTLPLLNRALRVIEDDFVDREFGTGVVKVTPAHDPNDFLMGERHDLPRINVMDEDGTINAEGGPYAGLDRFEARRKVVADLEAQGLLVKVEDHQHAVPQCDRCSTIIEPYLSEQWFVKIQPLADRALQAVRDGRVRFHPERFTTNYVRWMENIRDWCISRQLWWGHRIPVYYCDACGEQMVCREAPAACGKCGSADVRQDEDVLDTWFSSWLWPFTTLGWPEQTPELAYYYPTDTLVTGHEILYLWVSRMIMSGLEFMGDVPFRDVYLHGMIRDAQGRKMSKSLGNGIDPIDLFDRYGADATRFAIVRLTAEGQDLNFASEMTEVGRNFCNKLWNAFRLVEMQLPEEFARAPTAWEALPRAALPDRWILSRLAHTAHAVGENIDQFHLHEALDRIYHFFWSDFCDWYLEMAKVRWYGEDPAAQSEAQVVAYNVLRGIIVMLHPFVPFICEEMWQTLGAHRDRPLITHAWPDPPATFIDERLEAEQKIVHDLIAFVRNVRAEYNVKPGAEVDVYITATAAETAAMLRAERDTIRRLGRVGGLTIDAQPDVPQPAAAGVVGELEIALPLAGLVDLEKERQRLAKELETVERNLGNMRQKLENPTFLEKAPAELVANTRSRVAEQDGRAEKLRASLAALG